MSQFRTLCIFCRGESGTRITEEHIFPDWLREVFPRSPIDTYTLGRASWPDAGDRTPLVTQQRKQGHVSGRRVRVVCQRCNNEWLSDLESRTQPLLRWLMRGSPCALGPEAKLHLATWASKTVMTAEYFDRSKVVIPQRERTLLMQTLRPPAAKWWIWVAGNGGRQWEAGLSHLSGRMNPSKTAIVSPRVPNTQSTTIGLGRLLLYCISTTWPTAIDFVPQHPDRTALQLIWPPDGHTIKWPPTALLSDVQIDAIARNLARTFPGMANQPQGR